MWRRRLSRPFRNIRRGPLAAGGGHDGRRGAGAPTSCPTQGLWEAWLAGDAEMAGRSAACGER